MLVMASRLPHWACVSVVALLALLVPQPSNADIGFTQAIATARLLNPGKTLVSLRHRVRNQGAEYNTGCIDSTCVTMYGVDIDAASGTLIGIATEPIIYPENIAMRDVMDRMHLVQFDFEQALARARTATGRPDALVARIDLVSELFLIFYDLRYTDGSRFMVDAITGSVLPAVDVANAANSITPAQMTAFIQRAIEDSNSTSSWYPIMGETAVTADGIAVGITLLNPTTGRLRQIDMLGTQSQVIEFLPIGHLTLTVAQLRPVVAGTAVTAAQFLARIEQDFPQGTLSAFGLQSRPNGGVVRTTWSASVFTSLDQPLEFAIDAMTPIGAAFGVATAQQNFKPGDLDRNGAVDGADLAQILVSYNRQYPPYDLDQDGWVKGEDLAILLANWG